MKMRHVIEYLIFVIAAFFLRLLPLKTVQRIGSASGEFVYTVFGFRREIALKNLRFAFHDKTEGDLNYIARGAFRNVGIALCEFLWLPRFTTERIRSVMHCENPELVREIHARGKGVILLGAHLGNWELLAQCICLEAGLSINIIVQSQSNTLIDRSINKIRTRFGNKIIPMGIAIREIFRVLQHGDTVGILADQSAPMESITIEFFGRKVPTHEGPAAFSLKTRAPIILCFAVRNADGAYRVKFEEVPSSDLRSYNQENIIELTRRHVEMTEKYIRQYPDQWMWMHKRWKHVPAVEPLAVRTTS